MIYFTADLHFSHKKIMAYCGRQFANVDVMDNHIIKKYNSVVGVNDTCYILGDITLAATKQKLFQLVNRLNGTKILIAGNHDRYSVTEYLELGFSTVHSHMKLVHNTTEVYLAHDPAFAQIPNTVWFCGHVHKLFKKLKTAANTKVVNVGVDVWDYLPQSMDSLLKFVDDEQEVLQFTGNSYAFRPNGLVGFKVTKEACYEELY